MTTLTLSKLNTYVRRVLAINFQDPIWITAEILDCTVKSGHTYLELAEKDETNSIVAKASAVLWSTQRKSIQERIPLDLENILRTGIEVRVCVRVDYHIRFGLKLLLEQVDTSFTLGQLALTRQKTIAKLIEEQLWQRNKAIDLPVVIQRVALLTSAGTAAYADFVDQLTANSFGYQFQIEHFDVTVQGESAAGSLKEAFHKVSRKSNEFDAVVLVRGGGSKHDLFDFDSYELAKTISTCVLPVLTGIGHQVNESIADLSAHTALKTPTAAAEFILQWNSDFESKLKAEFQYILRQTKNVLSEAGSELHALRQKIHSSADVSVLRNNHRVIELNNHFHNVIRLMIAQKRAHLQALHHILDSNDPELILTKGYSLSYVRGSLVTTESIIEKGDELVSRFSFGNLKSIMESEWPKEN